MINTEKLMKRVKYKTVDKRSYFRIRKYNRMIIPRCNETHMHPLTKNTKPSRDKSTLLESTLLRIYFFGIYSFGIYSFKTLNNSWATANNYIITKTIFFLWNTSLKNSILESSYLPFFCIPSLLKFLPNFSLDSSLSLYYKHTFKLNSIYLWIPL
ncbi:hypothetical protein H8356DRAFT_1432249 [Neocallimastix lanati (nom. inval.)]|nr:hypothetical protein H8356DRAFT_1432249 [Neocallimastix sp. JGI-2020a]